jgi:hypothetical protein
VQERGHTGAAGGVQGRGAIYMSCENEEKRRNKKMVLVPHFIDISRILVPSFR